MAGQTSRQRIRGTASEKSPRAKLTETCRVPLERLRRELDPMAFAFQTTADLDPLDGPFGQDRAVESLRFGLGVSSEGFNVFVAGQPGTGRTSVTRSCVDQAASGRPKPSDWCYVNNFDDSYRPLAVALPAGQGRHFVHDVANLIATTRQRVHDVLDGDEYRRQRDLIQRRHRQQHEQMMDQLNETARSMGFQLIVGPTGVATIPLGEGGPISDEAYQALPEIARQEIRDREEQLAEQISEAVARARSREQTLTSEISDLTRQTVRTMIEPAFAELRTKYDQIEKVAAYLDRLKDDFLEHFDELLHTDERGGEAGGSAILERLIAVEREDALARYAVNLVVDNAELAHAPVICESNPTYYNLLGRIEYSARLGAMTTNFQMIKAGALHRANGGFLIIDLLELIRNPLSWDVLKRALATHQIQIENIAEQFSSIPTTTLRPEPIPLDVKVVLVGSPMHYYLLGSLDEDLHRLFKVKADFDTDMAWTPGNVQQFAAFLSHVVKERSLLPFDRSAIARIAEYSTRLAGDQEKISTRFAQISDLAAEANFWAMGDHCVVCGADHVQKAIDQKTRRSSLIEEKLRDLVAEGTIFVDVDGQSVGQINGLAVLSLGDYEFGRPVRVTAQAAVGARGLINVEREAHLSGPIHNKGFLILSSFLAGRYGQDKPLAVDARITFEQSYEEVEGDSAASTELYALLSSLADLPIRQDIAVTGSVDQRGRIQPVGGVTEKVEGFFDLCRLRGLTGRQGVMLPAANVRNLTLRRDVVDAVRAGTFHIWMVETIDEGIEILTGVSVGSRRGDGSWEPNSVNDRVEHRLLGFSQRLRAYGHPIESNQATAPAPPEVTPRTPQVGRSPRQWGSG